MDNIFLICLWATLASIDAGESWEVWAGINCYQGHGGKDLEKTQGSSCGVMSLAKCEQKCDELPACTGVTISQESECYRRGELNLTLCDHDDDYNTYVKSSGPPRPAPTPTPTPTPAPPPPAPKPAPTPSHYGPGAGPWEHVSPEAVGLKKTALDEAFHFINENVKGRQCFLLVKDGKLAMEEYMSDTDPADTAVACDVEPAENSGKLYVTAQKCTDEPGQKGWTYDSRLKQVRTPQGCLDAVHWIADASGKYVYNVQIRPCNASNPLQQWHYSPAAKMLLIKHGGSSYCLMPGNIGVGPIMTLWSCNGQPYEMFDFVNGSSGTSLRNGKIGSHKQIQHCMQVTSAKPGGLGPDPTGYCQLGTTFGCAGNNSMWVTSPCGVNGPDQKFKCNGRDVTCVSKGTKTNCNCDMENKPHEGYSMTKSIGAFIIFLAATQDGLDLDADITTSYGIQSPKPYGVSLRMMMAQVLGGDHRPGELWRYDELGDMWMHLMPKVVENATGHPASYYMGQLTKELGLSAEFAWEDVNTKWYRGMKATCRDWARFGQLILNQGIWGGKQLIAQTYFEQMTQPVKYKPYNEYSNPCYGLLVWINADKTKHPGCCWEASRLPPPSCNEDTFMPGAVHDMALIIGLYGQVAMTLPSVNTVVIGFGTDLRPIEPARIGYYPGLCKALGLPCNTPPAVPAPKCGSHLECTGITAQCFSGGAWNHSEPKPGHAECMRCIENRLPQYEVKFPEAHDMVKNWCPTDPRSQYDFLHCFCNTNSNPFAPWPTTTTTTLPLSPVPPSPPAPPSPPPPSPPPACMLKPGCLEALDAYACKRYGGQSCFSCLHSKQSYLTTAGCPDFNDEGFAGRGFCWCGGTHESQDEDIQMV